MDYRQPKPERNREICEQYRAGDTMATIAARHGINESWVCRILHRGGARLPRGDPRRNTGSGGRPRVLPELSAEMAARYIRLRKTFGAVEARRRINAQQKTREMLEKWGLAP